MRHDRTKRTQHEDRLVELLCQGLTNAEIGKAVHRQTCSVSEALREIYKAHKVPNRAAMAFLEGKRMAGTPSWVICEDRLPELDTPVGVAFDTSPSTSVGTLTRVDGIRQWAWLGPQHGEDGGLLCVVAWYEIPPRPGGVRTEEDDDD